mmetsp:Transcript_32729/g.73624  ORF Transcript_32729/g.73624 Transcript_32729/m.73624 type:complete len:117 (-) Transcript_32729:81-431(-)
MLMSPPVTVGVLESRRIAARRSGGEACGQRSIRIRGAQFDTRQVKVSCWVKLWPFVGLECCSAFCTSRYRSDYTRRTTWRKTLLEKPVAGLGQESRASNRIAAQQVLLLDDTMFPT